MRAMRSSLLKMTPRNARSSVGSGVAIATATVSAGGLRDVENMGLANTLVKASSAGSVNSAAGGVGGRGAGSALVATGLVSDARAGRRYS